MRLKISLKCPFKRRGALYRIFYNNGYHGEGITYNHWMDNKKTTQKVVSENGMREI
jgi:hypothetical protein